MVGRGKAVLFIAAILGSTAVAGGTAAAAKKFMSVTGITSSPIGHVRFCAKHRSECAVRSSRAKVMGLTRDRWHQLLDINNNINARIAPVTDQDLYNVVEHWTYPKNAGDCEDYALLKRRTLIRKGWPASALLITVVRQSDGSGHAVLTVRTNYGEFVLDNQINAVLRWHETPYRFIKRQSETDAASWRRINDRRLIGNKVASN